MRKVLEGLKRGGCCGGGGGRSANGAPFLGERTHGDCLGDGGIGHHDDEDSSYEGDADEHRSPRGKHGGAAGGREDGGAAVNSPARSQEEGENDDDSDEDQDVFEVGGAAPSPPPGPAPAAGYGQRGQTNLGTNGPSGEVTGAAAGAINAGNGGGGATFTPQAAMSPTASTVQRMGGQTPQRVEAGSGVMAVVTDRGVAAGEGTGMPEVPQGLKAGVETRLEEACDAFRGSIRRAVLNYVLLDAGQRDRLGAENRTTQER